MEGIEITTLLMFLVFKNFIELYTYSIHLLNSLNLDASFLSQRSIFKCFRLLPNEQNAIFNSNESGSLHFFGACSSPRTRTEWGKNLKLRTSPTPKRAELPLTSTTTENIISSQQPTPLHAKQCWQFCIFPAKSSLFPAFLGKETFFCVFWIFFTNKS